MSPHIINIISLVRGQITHKHIQSCSRTDWKRGSGAADGSFPRVDDLPCFQSFCLTAHPIII